MEHTQPVDLGVEWSAGAPMPTVLADEDTAHLVFYLSDVNPGPEQTGVIEWTDCVAFTFGFPGDETQGGHRLWRESNEIPPLYHAVEVIESGWIAELVATERTHPNSSDQSFAQHRHFVLLFHDSTFECVATGFTVERRHESVDEVVAELSARRDGVARRRVTFTNTD